MTVGLPPEERTHAMESSLHLYQPPRYRATPEQGAWKTSFLEAARDVQGPLTWDSAAVLSILSYGHVCGDRTLVREVRRQPWLSRAEPHKTVLRDIPPHGRSMADAQEIAPKLDALLREEAAAVCEGYKEIYVLLSGGLDSRIVACGLTALWEERRIHGKPVALTWGTDPSRDTVYARQVAAALGLDWVHIPLGPSELRANVLAPALESGALVSPVHLHGTPWFQQLPSDALILTGSYGDSVGRAEYSGKHLLACTPMQPPRVCPAIRSEFHRAALQGLTQDLEDLARRSGKQPTYATCEHEQQGHYMRNLIGPAMTAAGHGRRVYHMFTHPAIYTYMWSLHPACRGDDIYGRLLDTIYAKVARIPWARTNRDLKGRTSGAHHGLPETFHDYPGWAGNALYDMFEELVDPDWFAGLGMFEPDSIRRLAHEVRVWKRGRSVYVHSFYPYERWLWLAAFRKFAESLDAAGIRLKAETPDGTIGGPVCPSAWPAKRNRIQRVLSRIPPLFTLQRRCRQRLKQRRCRRLKLKSLHDYPPCES